MNQIEDDDHADSDFDAWQNDNITRDLKFNGLSGEGAAIDNLFFIC